MTSGVLLVNKAAGATSAKTTARVKHLLAAKKAGHGGTLDPMADGLLVILLDAATAFSRFLLHGKKVYQAQICFGVRTDTDDADGEIVETKTTPATLQFDIKKNLPKFIGEYEQTAPRHSALKHRGKPLYYYARRDLPAPDKTRLVSAQSIVLNDLAGNIASFEIRCGGGYYVRSFARDLGDAIGCGAHLRGLRRLQSGKFSLADSLSAQTLQTMDAAARAAAIKPVDDIVNHLRSHCLPLSDIQKLSGGGAADYDGDIRDGENDGELLRLYSPQHKFAGVATVKKHRLYSIILLPWTRRDGPPFN